MAQARFRGRVSLHELISRVTGTVPGRPIRKPPNKKSKCFLENKVNKSRNRVRQAAKSFGMLETLEDRRLMSVAVISKGPMIPVITKVDTFTVTSSGDNKLGFNPRVGAGTGTLRQAIVDADADTSGRPITINFSIDNGNPTPINLIAQLPNITRAMTINGLSQSGPGNNIYLTLEGDNLSPTHAPTGVGLNVTGPGGVTIQGLQFDHFNVGVSIAAGSTNNHLSYNRTEQCLTGIEVDGSGNFIGASDSGNTILNLFNFSNARAGIEVTGSNNTIQHNSVEGMGVGIEVDGGASNRIFSDTVYQSRGDGILINGGTGNTISRNALYQNAGLGIDFQSQGNGNQAAPQLSAAIGNGTASVLVTGTVKSSVDPQSVEVFASQQANEGQVYLGTVTVQPGQTNFSQIFTLSSGTALITATATDAVTGNTSVFSNAIAAPVVPVWPIA